MCFQSEEYVLMDCESFMIIVKLGGGTCLVAQVG